MGKNNIMKIISHRGNINGRIEEAENRPDYIEDTIRLGYDVEIDVWIIEDTFYLGHNEPQYMVSLNWLNERKDNLWIHCKNIEAMEWFNSLYDTYNYFWHENDTAVLTSKGYIWSYINKFIKGGITVCPNYIQVPNYILGVCTDYPDLY